MSWGRKRPPLVIDLAEKPENRLMAIYQNSEKQSIGAPKESLLVSLATGSGNYWFSFVSDPLTVVFFLFWEAVILRSNILVLGLTFGAGLLSFSLAEYDFPRCVYHKGEPRLMSATRNITSRPKR